MLDSMVSILPWTYFLWNEINRYCDNGTAINRFVCKLFLSNDFQTKSA